MWSCYVGSMLPNTKIVRRISFKLKDIFAICINLSFVTTSITGHVLLLSCKDTLFVTHKLTPIPLVLTPMISYWSHSYLDKTFFMTAKIIYTFVIIKLNLNCHRSQEGALLYALLCCADCCCLEGLVGDQRGEVGPVNNQKLVSASLAYCSL